ncbi:histidine phosphatase family protein [Peribacillus kribbensis]|uniref:histidine phosphatase family protein n=1 Tax=Peribacillus kribbensis TaxID=356658 RepID=UPI00054D8AB3|nr:histidine phosphatase family protein [Peribacillus kribbensis]
MLTVYLVRHGKTEWNEQSRWQGRGNGELTQEGIQGALRLQSRLKDEPIQMVYSSSSKRAYHTAELIVGDRPIPIIKDDLLREMHFGDWEGRTKSEVMEQYGPEVQAFWDTPHLYSRKLGEQFPDVYKRAEEAWNKIVDKHVSGTILLVSHSIFLRVLLSYIKEIPLEHVFHQQPLLNTSLSKLEVQDGEAKIVFQGDISHLDPTS